MDRNLRMTQFVDKTCKNKLRCLVGFEWDMIYEVVPIIFETK